MALQSRYTIDHIKCYKNSDLLSIIIILTQQTPLTNMPLRETYIYSKTQAQEIITICMVDLKSIPVKQFQHN